LLVRPEIYEEDEKRGRRRKAKRKLIIAKQRNGPVGEIPLTFLKEFTRFEDRARNVKNRRKRFEGANLASSFRAKSRNPAAEPLR